jgi:hypothetical protein
VKRQHFNWVQKEEPQCKESIVLRLSGQPRSEGLRGAMWVNTTLVRPLATIARGLVLSGHHDACRVTGRTLENGMLRHPSQCSRIARYAPSSWTNMPL